MLVFKRQFHTTSYLKERYDKMKKVFAKTLAFLALFGMISGSAMAADPIEVYNDDGVITVKVSELESGEETSLLVTKGTATIAEAFADTTKVYHIDQVAAKSDGVSEFKFSYAGTDTLTVYSGYATMAATDDPYKTVVDESTQPTPGTSYTLGDVNDDTAVNVSDVTAVVQFILNGTAFTKVDETPYPQGEDAADVNADSAVNVSDVTKIVNYILNGTSFAE